MYPSALFDPSVLISCPPPGSRNVRIGKSIEGPGGRWVPCATALSDGSYVACLFEVGPGRKQVCAGSRSMNSAEEALSEAIELASTAAA